MDSNQRDRDIGQLASWSVSSSKPGYDVEQLTDPNLDTLWQSEGPQPHLINIQFPKRMTISQIAMFVDVGIDDSYTPNRISIRAGTYFGDIQEVKLIELENPKGWQYFNLGNASEDDQDIDYNDPEAFGIQAHLVQVAILSNHLSGKDTHIRHMKVFGPRNPSDLLANEDSVPFTSQTFKIFESIR